MKNVFFASAIMGVNAFLFSISPDSSPLPIVHSSSFSFLLLFPFSPSTNMFFFSLYYQFSSFRLFSFLLHPPALPIHSLSPPSLIYSLLTPLSAFPPTLHSCLPILLRFSLFFSYLIPSLFSSPLFSPAFLSPYSFYVPLPPPPPLPLPYQNRNQDATPDTSSAVSTA